LRRPRSPDDPVTRSASTMNIQKMMQQAQAMQSKMQQELEALRIEASSGGGMVTIAMSGTKEILSVRIDPTCVDPKDVETLQDLVLAACREAARQVDEAVQKKTSAMLGGMMPGMR
jgi:nucleoid-associated protein EbfC